MTEEERKELTSTRRFALVVLVILGLALCVMGYNIESQNDTLTYRYCMFKR